MVSTIVSARALTSAGLRLPNGCETAATAYPVMPASFAMASAVDWKGSVITAAAGMPRFSKVMASSTLPDEHDPQSPMAVMTTAQRPASFSASPSVTGALALVLDTRTTSPI